MSGSLIHYHFRSVLARKFVASGVALGVALAAFVACATSMLDRSIHALFALKNRPESVIVLAGGASSEIESNIDVEQLRRILMLPEIRRVDGNPTAAADLVLVLTLPRTGPNARDVSSNVVLRGVDPAGIAYRQHLRVVEGRLPAPGTLEAMVGRSIRGSFEHLDIGQALDFGEGKAVRIVGVFEDGGAPTEAEVFIDISAMQGLFGRAGMYSSVRLDLGAAEAFDAFKSEVEKGRGIGMHALRANDYDRATAGDLADFVTLVGGFIGALLAMGASLGALVVMYGSVASRSKEIGTLRALGFSRGSIIFGILTEAMIISLAGSAIGIASALALSRRSISLMGPNWAEIEIVFVPTAGMILSAVGVALLTALVGGLFPAWRSLRVPTVDALRT